MPEITTLSILSKQNTVYDQPDITSINWDTICLAKLKQALSSAKSIVVGPGIGRSKAVADMITQLLLQPNLPPVVFDADALFAIAHKPELFSLLRPCDILTPHPGEAATILGITTKDIQKQRVTALKQLASLASSAWILKGAGTLISVHGKPITICPWNIPQLAVAGSGDILAGILGTLLAQGQSSETAAVKGVWIHAMCGIQLAHQFPMRGNSPMDIANAIPSILPLVDKI
jgi:NAD(P)H-hydrate epimerase